MGEHDLSRTLRQALLPRNAPRVEGYDIGAGTMIEERGRAATVWDWLLLADGRTALVTLDVRADGLPPAIHLATARGVLRAVVAEGGGLEQVLPRMNAAMAACAVDDVSQHVECGVLVVDGEHAEWASAGRVPGGVIRRGGVFEELASHGPPLGMMEGFQYGCERVTMGTGDTAIVLSHASTGLFRGAADLVAQIHGKPAGEVVSTLHRGIRKAQGENPEEISVLFVRKH
jgi:serine phosphatase RsbU (regulator of sigma subunit)